LAKIENLKDHPRLKTLRVLHISSARTWRGGENQIQLLLNGLSSECRNHLLCPHESPLSKNIDIKRVSLHTYKKSSGISISISQKVRKTCSIEAIDIIHAHDSHAHNFALGAALLGCKLPIVVTRRVDFKPSIIALYKYNHHSIKKVVCVSNAIENILKKRGIHLEKLTTIHSGIDLVSKIQGRNLRNELNISKEKIIIGFVGAFVDHKDPMTFLQMATSVLNERKNYHFIMIGNNGECISKMNRYIEENMIQKSVTVLGFTNKINNIWTTIDTLVISSFKEGLGTVALEAFHNKISVVCTNAGGLKEIVQNEVNGLVVEPRDYNGLKNKLFRMSDEIHLKEKLVTQAKFDVSHFDHKKMSESYLKIYQNLS